MQKYRVHIYLIDIHTTHHVHTYIHINHTHAVRINHMHAGLLYAQYAKEHYKRDDILQKRPIILKEPTNRSHPIADFGGLSYAHYIIAFV